MTDATSARARWPRSGSAQARAHRRGSASASALALPLLAASVLAACAPGGESGSRETVVFWAMGHEGEIARTVLDEFEELHPEIEVVVQQVPWTAAHEKLVTAVVGRSTPDVSQLGNTWIAEFVALGALEPLGTWVAGSEAVRPDDYFTGIWDTNVIGGVPYGVPWYVDTRLLFYRTDLLASAGYDSLPTTWSEWRTALGAMKAELGPDAFPLFLPVNEWPPAVIFGLQNGSSLLGENETRGAFSEAPFREALSFYVDLFREGYAPATANNEIGNLYQEFSRGHVNGFITGPWNLGEMKNRLPAEQADIWSTAPLPGPRPGTPGVSLAGGSSLVLFRGSKRKAAAWKLVEFLSLPETQARFYELSGDLPARLSVWNDPPFTDDARLAAFGAQLAHVVPTPKIPEWEQIAYAVQEHAEVAVRGDLGVDSTLARLDRRVDRILEKRRWLHEHGRLASVGGR